MPWYDPERERQAVEKSEDIHRRSIAARIRSEQVRADYAEMARRLRR